ncbi:MAG TPA: Ig-like domain-containing protein, partial [Fibrobacteria bacterium]|nr:Ig-like domain-containing protein [Fibrobacteria bacterium]
MNGFNLHLQSRNGGGRFLPGGMRRIGKTLVTTAAALSLALMACSDGGKSKSPVKVVDPSDGTKSDPGKVLSALDSLVKANKGKGVITGYLSGEGKTVAKGLLKQARNAAGEVRLLSRSEIPLSGATVLIFNAEKPTTVADTTLKTDSTGTYTAALNEGKYFGFAVYLDLETFQLVTTQIPNISPRKDTVVKMDTAVAMEDVTAPTVVGVYDATAANDDGVFLVGAVPATDAKINIVFSEPMNRESAKGVLLGKVDTAASSTSLVLADTVKNVAMTWSGDSKELTLNVASLSEGVQYAIIIPVGIKDLAKNPLESKFLATFVPVKAEELKAIPFGVAATFPAKDGDKSGSLKPIQNPAISFNRPVDVFSIVKGATIEPAHVGFWEVSGARASFVHKTPFEVGRTYTVTLPAEIKDLAGNTLGTAQSFSFTVKDFEGAAATATGADKAVALAVEAMFDAYLAGDIGRFAAAFHPNFRMFQGSDIQSKTQFIEKMKMELGEQVNMKAGFLAPVFDNDSSACKDHVQRWKVAAQGDASLYVWVESFSNPGSVPRVWDKDRKEIDRSKLSWDKTGPRFTFEGKVYGFAADFSRFGGSVNMDAARDNGRFMGELMAKTSTIVLEPVKLDLKEEFKVDGGLVIKSDTARLVVKLSGKETFSRTNFEPNRSCEGGAATQEHFEILKFLLVNDGSRWMVLNIIAPDEKIKNLEDFNRQVDVNQDFGGSNVTPIALTAPVNGRANALENGKVAFKFNGVKHDSVGGYLVGLAEDPKFIGGRPPFGLLLFVKASKKDGSEETFSLDASAKVATDNAIAVLRRVHDLRLPGWERTLFEYTLTKLHNPDSGFAGVYNWKAIAVKDTSAAQFLANGFKMERFLGESDFGPNRGHFAVARFPAATQFAQFENQQFNQPPINGGAGGPMGFTDADMDGVMDFIEQKYGTDPRDRNSYPDFRVDTDGDKMADFLEKKLDPEGKDSLVEKAADAAGLKAQIASLARLNPPIVIMDGDGDGFPDDVEQMLGFNPMDPFSNPGTRVRANVPVGVFAGKVQMGSSTHSVSFKLYQDSLKNLMVAFTAVIGRDTIIDTSRAGFNENMGEVLMALRLPMNGPDAGRALLLRGNYKATQSLLMGPVDMISAPAKTSVNFGGGPYVGQFAASGRGEDVSRYLPGAGGGSMSGPATGPVTGPATTVSYRP